MSKDIKPPVEEKIKTLFGKLGRVNKRIEEDAEDFALPDNPAELLASYERYADNLADEIPQKHSLQCFVRMAKNSLKRGDEAGLKANLLKFNKHYDVAHNNEETLSKKATNKAKGKRRNPAYSKDLNELIELKIKSLSTTNAKDIFNSLDGEQHGCITGIDREDDKLIITTEKIKKVTKVKKEDSEMREIKDYPLTLSALRGRITNIKKK